MLKKYRPWNPDQTYLFPPSAREWLPKNHLAFFLLDIMDEFDLEKIEEAIQEKDPRGERPYDPRMMVALLVYCYCTGVYSSRKIEMATYEDVATRMLSGESHPHFTTINEFRRVHRETLSLLFFAALDMCRRAGMVKMGHVSIDGSKVKANASKHKAMSYKRMEEKERELLEQVKELLERADEVDEREDELYGKGKREWEMPEELLDRETRLKRIREIKAEMDAEAKKKRAQQLREQGRELREKAETETRERYSKAHRSNARHRDAQADELDPEGGQESPEQEEATALPEHSIRVTPDGKPNPDVQRNFTDPESCLMQGSEGLIQAYNCQIAVDDEHQVIVANGVTNQPPDSHNLLPMVHRIEESSGQVPGHVSADNGYWNADVEGACAALGANALVATGRVKHGQCGPPTKTGPPPDDLDARERMRHKLDTEQGRELYACRKWIVEPVFGQIKEARGFRRFSFRGLRAVIAEWSLICACHNLLKLFRYGGWSPVPA
jgi:transposase